MNRRKFIKKDYNENSGAAIALKLKELEYQTSMLYYNYNEHRRKIIKQTGEILIDLIPEIYDTK